MRQITKIVCFIIVTALAATSFCKAAMTGEVKQKVEAAMAIIFPEGIPKELTVTGMGRFAYDIPKKANKFYIRPTYSVTEALNKIHSGSIISSDPTDGTSFRNIFASNDRAPVALPADGSIRPIPQPGGRRFEIYEFRANVLGGGQERLLVDVVNNELYFTGDHYVHTIPYSSEFGQFFPLNGMFTRKIRKEVFLLERNSLMATQEDALASMNLYQEQVHGTFRKSERDFRAQFKERMSADNYRSWKKDATWEQIRDAYVYSWENRVEILQADGFSAAVRDLGLEASAVTPATHDAIKIKARNDNIFINFFDKRQPNAGQFYQKIDGKFYKITKFAPKGLSWAEHIVPAGSKAPAIPTDPCRRRLYVRQSGGCIRERPKFQPNAKEPSSLKYQVTFREAEVATAKLEEIPSGRAFTAALKSWSIAKPFVETGVRIVEHGLTALMVGFDSYEIIQACKARENRDVRDCAVNVIILILDIASTIGCGLVAGVAGSVICGLCAAVLTHPFAAGLVSLGESLNQSFNEMYRLFAEGRIDAAYQHVLGQVQQSKDQFLAKFDPLMNYVLRNVRSAQTYFGRAINTLNGWLGGDEFEGEFSTFEIVLPAALQERLQRSEYRFISVTQVCGNRLIPHSTKTSEMVPISSLITLQTPRCDYIQDVKQLNIHIHRTEFTGGQWGEECQSGIPLQGEERKNRLAPYYLQLIGWRPVVHWIHEVNNCNNLPL